MTFLQLIKWPWFRKAESVRDPELLWAAHQVERASRAVSVALEQRRFNLQVSWTINEMEIAKAKRRKKAVKHLYARREALTAERLREGF